ncbi:MAG: hypothetical protein ACRCTZ_07485 [Sarcina sp.]
MNKKQLIFGSIVGVCIVGGLIFSAYHSTRHQWEQRYVKLHKQSKIECWQQ